MIELECDDRKVERELLALYDQVIKHGAHFHPGMKVISSQGNLSVACGPSARPGDRLMRIAEPCLLPIDKFDLYVADDDICIRSYEDGLLDTHVELFEHTINLFNLTKKITQHRASSFWTVFASVPTLVNRLARGRGPARQLEIYLDHYNGGEIDRLLLSSFFKTRTFSLKSAYFGGQVRVILSLIDLVNHNFQAQSYQTSKNENTGLAQVEVMISKAVAGSNECFVRYGMFDSLDTYLVYSFVDDSAPFVRSIPLELHLGCGVSLKANAHIASRKKDLLPPNMQDLRMFMPPVLRRDQDSIEVTHLVIPDSSSPYALRRVLAALIGSVRPGMSLGSLWDSVQEAESIIVSENKKYYDAINLEIGNLRGGGGYEDRLHDVERMVTLQMAKIEAYEALDKEPAEELRSKRNLMWE